MTSYIIRRLLLMLPTLIGIMTLCFLISEFVPGGPIDQIRARLEGRGPGSGSHEAGGASGNGNRGAGEAKKKIDPKDEMRLLRQYGYHTTRLERYLRTILWYSPDSAITSKEIDAGEGVYFQSHRRKHIVVRIKDGGNDAYRAFEAAPLLGMKTVPQTGFFRLFSSTRQAPDYGNEVFYDKNAGMLRDTLDEKICYDAATGTRIPAGSGPGLVRLDLKARLTSRRTAYRLDYAEGKISNLLADSILQEARQKATPADPVRKEADGTETMVTRLPNQTLTTR